MDCYTDRRSVGTEPGKRPGNSWRKQVEWKESAEPDPRRPEDCGPRAGQLGDRRVHIDTGPEQVSPGTVQARVTVAGVPLFPWF